MLPVPISVEETNALTMHLRIVYPSSWEDACLEITYWLRCGELPKWALHFERIVDDRAAGGSIYFVHKSREFLN